MHQFRKYLIDRRSLLLTGGLISIIPAGCLQSPDEAVKSPNILLVLTDDQGYADVGCCGASDMLTPNMDSLFSMGIRFTRFYANSSVCSPTRASLLTGQYPDAVGVPGVIRTNRNNWGYFSPEATTIAGVLQEYDYSTAIIGKWHLGMEAPNIPNHRGFDYFKGFLGDMMDDYWSHTREGKNLMRENLDTIDPEGHATDLFTQWAVDYIMLAAEKNDPWFLYLAYNAPHYPIQPPDSNLQSVKQRQPGLTEKRAALVAFIEHLDQGIGRVIDALVTTGQMQNTLVLFLSDNGGRLLDGANNGPLRDGKQSMYEGGLLVPACAVWVNKIIPGSVTNIPVMSMDIFPTICKMLDLPAHPETRGVSFLPLLLGEEYECHINRTFYFVRREGNMNYAGQCIYALQWNNWKLLQTSPFAPQELYNLADDPCEANPLNDKYPEIHEALNEKLMQHIREGGRVPWQSPAR